MGLRGKLTTNASLRKKLTTIIMLSCFIVVLLASGSFLTTAILSYKVNKVSRLT